MFKSLVYIAIVLVALVITTVRLGAIRWSRQTTELRTRLDRARMTTAPGVVAFAELASLPPVVQRFFRTVLEDGRPVVVAARLSHSGTFNMGERDNQWKPFISDQLVIIRRPGFDWNARIAIAPGLSALVHDAYVAGEGVLHASLLGVLTLADQRGTPEVAEGELMRFLAEAAWYPTALLPGQGVVWSPVDDKSARATLTDGPVTLSLTFVFGDDGLIDRVRADARSRTVNGTTVPTPWEGHFWNYVERDGMRVPLDGEVAWHLPDGPRPYWRGHVDRVTYELARPGT